MRRFTGIVLIVDALLIALILAITRHSLLAGMGYTHATRPLMNGLVTILVVVNAVWLAWFAWRWFRTTQVGRMMTLWLNAKEGELQKRATDAAPEHRKSH